MAAYLPELSYAIPQRGGPRRKGTFDPPQDEETRPLMSFLNGNINRLSRYPLSTSWKNKHEVTHDTVQAIAGMQTQGHVGDWICLQHSRAEWAQEKQQEFPRELRGVWLFQVEVSGVRASKGTWTGLCFLGTATRRVSWGFIRGK